MAAVEHGSTLRSQLAYLASLAPFILVFVAGGLGWSIAPLEHLRPTPANLAAGVTTLVLGLVAVRSQWGRPDLFDRSSGIAPEFEPPEGIRPAEADLLLRGRPERRDVIATVIDLALRGHLRIDEARTAEGEPTWTFERGDGAADDLREYERVALAGLFVQSRDVKLTALKARFYITADLVEEELDREIVKRGWFADQPGRLRSRWATAGWVTALAGIAVTFVLGNTLGLGLVGAAIFAVGVAVYATAPWRPARTAAGLALARRAAGFELFLRTAEAERHRFAERERLFHEYLPYAIALGLVEEWRRGFGLIDRPGAFDETRPQDVALQGGLVGLVGQLDAAAGRSRSRLRPSTRAGSDRRRS